MGREKESRTNERDEGCRIAAFPTPPPLIFTGLWRFGAMSARILMSKRPRGGAQDVMWLPLSYRDSIPVIDV